nr:metal ABC transporter substrate-binding protein [Corynebacterium suranareeae]
MKTLPIQVGPARALRKLLAVPAVAVSLAFGITACSTFSTADDTPDIVVTTNILGDVVEQLVGDSADVHVLMKPNADPHSFGVSAHDAAVMENADLIVANGLGLEEGLQSNVDNAKSQGVPVLEVGEHIGAIEYSPGVPDPHFWTDPARMITATKVIEAELIKELDPSLTESITNSAQQYREELKSLDEEVAELLTSVAPDNRKLITNHNVFGYLAKRFDYTVIGTIIPGGTTLAAPSASDLNDISTAIEDNNVPAIFTDTSSPQRLAEVLASNAGIDVQVVSVFTESLTDSDGEAPTYISMQKINAQRIASTLS